MTSYLMIKNWGKFQQCDRNAPWIKLYTSLLESYEFLVLSDSDKCGMMMILLYCGKNGNKIPNDREFLSSAFHLEKPINLEKLSEIGFLEPFLQEKYDNYLFNRNNKIKNRKQKDKESKSEKRKSETTLNQTAQKSEIPESRVQSTEREVRVSNETLTLRVQTSEPPKKRKPRPIITLDELSVSHISDWLSEKRSQGKYLDHDELSILEHFKNYCKSKGRTYADYTAALKNAFEWDSCQPRSKYPAATVGRAGKGQQARNAANEALAELGVAPMPE